MSVNTLDEQQDGTIHENIMYIICSHHLYENYLKNKNSMGYVL